MSSMQTSDAELTFWKEADEATDWEAESRKAFEFWKSTLQKSCYVVAPMVDASELAWRLLSRRHGAQLCYTPMYHASLFVRDERYRRDALASCAEDRPLIVQFCSNDPDLFAEAAKLAEDHCDAIDLNLGCPQSIAKKGHYGAFLQDEWELIYKMVNKCYRILKKPITCKIRRFESKERTVNYARMLQAAGCRLLTVHGRTREMKGMHTGLADWSYITAVRKAVQIPVFANGNIQYMEDVQRCLEETGVQGVMSAEGNLHNPAIFTKDLLVCWDVAREYLDIARQYPCHTSFVRGHLFKIFHHALQKHMEYRTRLAKAKTMDEFEYFIENLRTACKPDCELYATNPEEFSEKKTGLRHPYWICQPYVRPSLEKASQRTEAKPHKQSALNIISERSNANGDSAGKAMSVKKAKKLIKNPCKTFAKKPSRFVDCKSCNNPKGMNCDFEMCKPCCKRYAIKEKVPCHGHKFLLKYKGKLEEISAPAKVKNTSCESTTEDTKCAEEKT